MGQIAEEEWLETHAELLGRKTETFAVVLAHEAPLKELREAAAKAKSSFRESAARGHERLRLREAHVRAKSRFESARAQYRAAKANYELVMIEIERHRLQRR